VKVVILHQHFNTPAKGGALRSYYLAKALADRGVEVIVITAHNSPRQVVETLENIQVYYLPVTYNNRFGFYRRSFSFSRFVLGAIRTMKAFGDADLCYAISVPLTVGIAALRIKKKYGIPFVFEVGDLWPDAPIDLGFIKNRLFQKALYNLEKKIYDNASAIVALSEPIRQALEQKTKNDNTYVLTNIADTEFFKPEPKGEMLQDKFKVRGKFVVSYIGAVGFANGLDFFLECARISKHSGQPVHFFICGDGAMVSGLKESARRLELDNLTFLPFQNREGVRALMNVTDACFICYRHEKILETGSPHKYFDALAAGKLTIINFNGWIKAEVEREKCGFSLDAGGPEEFVRQTDIFLQDRHKLAQYQAAARRLAEHRYTRVHLSEQFFRIVVSVLKIKK
jgi:glycosyltransferase involved in cell wall biosynthesis